MKSSDTWQQCSCHAIKWGSPKHSHFRDKLHVTLDAESVQYSVCTALEIYLLYLSCTVC